MKSAPAPLYEDAETYTTMIKTNIVKTIIKTNIVIKFHVLCKWNENQSLARKISKLLLCYPRVKAWRQGLSSSDTTLNIWLCKLAVVRGRSSDKTMLFVPPYTSSPSKGTPKYLACARIYKTSMLFLGDYKFSILQWIFFKKIIFHYFFL
jgi:hypothetical protein